MTDKTIEELEQIPAMSTRFRFVEPRFCTVDHPCPAHTYDAVRLHAEDAPSGALAFVCGAICGTAMGVLLTLAARAVADWWAG